MYVSSSQARRALAIAVASGLLLPTAPMHHAVAAEAAHRSPVEVEATYAITLNGFEIGSFHFNSNVTTAQYTVDTSVELSALLGIFRWKGVTRSSGTFADSAPRPAGFLFEFESSTKSGSVKMGFNQGAVQDISVVPAAIDPPDMVPLEARHLQGVLDPLSAILALTHAEVATPCGRKVAVFDGKQRFDLDLRYVRKEPIALGSTDIATVCRVKYTPIGGYRANEETRAMSDNTGIEIAFRPVPAAQLMLPQSVAMPTAAGAAAITLTSVTIKTPQRGRLALVN